jgi:hypothetical protein
MVHALRRARGHLEPGGTLVLVQPHEHKRAEIAIVSAGRRMAVATLINPVFQPLIGGANAAIQSVVGERLFETVATRHRGFKARLANPGQLRLFLHQADKPSRFPPGGRQRLLTLWKAQPTGARIEATLFITVVALRPTVDKR